MIKQTLSGWVVVVAVALATVGLLLLGACEARIDYADAPERKPPPQPSPVLRSYSLPAGAVVTEFRDSAGRICVLVVQGSPSSGSMRPVALDCAAVLPSLDYDQLESYGKRPL